MQHPRPPCTTIGWCSEQQGGGDWPAELCSGSRLPSTPPPLPPPDSAGFAFVPTFPPAFCCATADRLSAEMDAYARCCPAVCVVPMLPRCLAAQRAELPSVPTIQLQHRRCHAAKGPEQVRHCQSGEPGTLRIIRPVALSARLLYFQAHKQQCTIELPCQAGNSALPSVAPCDCPQTPLLSDSTPLMNCLEKTDGKSCEQPAASAWQAYRPGTRFLPAVALLAEPRLDAAPLLPVVASLPFGLV